MYHPHCGEKLPGSGPLDAVDPAGPLWLLLPVVALQAALFESLAAMMVELGG